MRIQLNAMNQDSTVPHYPEMQWSGHQHSTSSWSASPNWASEFHRGRSVLTSTWLIFPIFKQVWSLPNFAITKWQQPSKTGCFAWNLPLHILNYHLLHEVEVGSEVVKSSYQICIIFKVYTICIYTICAIYVYKYRYILCMHSKWTYFKKSNKSLSTGLPVTSHATLTTWNFDSRGSTASTWTLRLTSGASMAADPDFKTSEVSTSKHSLQIGSPNDAKMVFSKDKEDMTFLRNLVFLRQVKQVLWLAVLWLAGVRVQYFLTSSSQTSCLLVKYHATIFQTSKSWHE